jgi:hypothetical protein
MSKNRKNHGNVFLEAGKEAEAKQNEIIANQESDDKTVRVGVYMPADLRRRIKKYCADAEISMSDCVCKACLRFLSNE